MLYYDFMDFEDFKDRFGIIRHGNGAKNRKNKILLAYIKNKELLHQARLTNDYSLLHISSMSELKQVMLERIKVSGFGKKYQVQLINDTFGSDCYQTDEYHGLCEDHDFKSVRYINKTSGKVYKMKAGKLLRALIQETEFGQTLPEQVLGYLCEEFTQDWQTYVMGTLPKNQLVVSDEFQKIYSSSCCKGEFHSCMVDRDLHAFYHDAVDASAAYLTDEDGLIIARCIIYNKCYDEDGKVWRLAERQYSTDCNDILKRALVDALIREGKIDGYKKVGAGCCDSREFVDVNGQSLADKKFYIDCELETYDTLSYQDSFKFYNYGLDRAYNHQDSQYGYCLDTTDGSIDGVEEEENYDEYHDCYTENDTVTVLYDGREMSCDEDRLDDFTWCEVADMYVYTPETAYCEICGNNYINEDRIYSELTDEYYCCKDCKDTAEKEFKEENWFWSEFDHQYFENEDEITEIYKLNKEIKDYEALTVSKKTLNEMLESKEAFVFEGDVYDKINKKTGKPFFYYRRMAA